MVEHMSTGSLLPQGQFRLEATSLWVAVRMMVVLDKGPSKNSEIHGMTAINQTGRQLFGGEHPHQDEEMTPCHALS